MITPPPEKTKRGLSTVYGIILAMLAVGFFISTGGVAPTSVVSSTASNVTVNSYISFALSTNLSMGIQFGSVDPATNDNNATIGSGNANYNGTGNTTFWMYLGADSNANGDFCIKDNESLRNGGTGIPTIGNGNFTYANATIAQGNNFTSPDMSLDSGITIAYEKLRQTNHAPDARLFVRFWLDVPTAQPPGIYNNLVSFKAVTAGSSC